MLGDNNIPNHILLPNSQQIYRVHIIGTILRIQQTGTMASVVIDDGSASVLLRFFEEFPQIKHVSAGSTVSVIGKIRAYKEQIYIVPEIMKECDKAWLNAHKAITVNQQKEHIPETKEVTNNDSIIAYIQKNDTGSGIAISTLYDVFGDIDNIIDNMLKHGVVYAHIPGRIKLL